MDLFDDAPAVESPRLGPVFTATYGGDCPRCGWEIDIGDLIRADGQGSYIHADQECEK